MPDWCSTLERGFLCSVQGAVLPGVDGAGDQEGNDAVHRPHPVLYQQVHARTEG